MMRVFRNIDWVLFLAILPIMGAGLVTMYSFTGEGAFFDRQLLWVCASLCVFFVVSSIDVRFLKQTRVLIILFTICSTLLLLLFLLGETVKGSQSWFDFGGFSFQPADITKLVVVLILAKYFSRRHVEIGHWKHILVSGVYALVPFFLVFLQPDFGSAVIIFLTWFGMVLISGLSKKHLLIIFGFGLVIGTLLWFFVFQTYQQNRIMNFIHPLADIQGSGYNAYQSMVAVGSGEFLGKGVGYGTQSRLQFLPEYETDFIFAAFAEEWGFAGVILLFVLYGIVFWRLFANARLGASNFEILFTLGLAILFMSHVFINVGMNIGLLPVTGITLPFMSYGGSHLLTSFLGLGIVMAMRGYARTTHRENIHNEIVGIT